MAQETGKTREWLIPGSLQDAAVSAVQIGSHPTNADSCSFVIDRTRIHTLAAYHVHLPDLFMTLFPP